MRNVSIAMLIALTAAACGSVEEFIGAEPVVDMQGVNYAMYHADLMQCRDYADQVNVGRQVAVAATTGAAAAAVAGASVGNSDTAKRLAGLGAVAGSVKGVGRALDERQRVVSNCLSGRGYRVLN
ncbi:MAG: glycine zipper family protein [Gammaproteobacteria bacterium]|nr:glycine zipper family protein [Gammaproteobacteria bacterium]MCY3688973.1 glycine zipper family protein [Gammaproteobacteria bacterium]MDE0480280.1 glycine zipper family protein [Gammaproteobacteria bacterium]MXX07559.1 glycine zipper family protein [Gammaproteobacteria bacterium]MXY89638.1 glycine zipper family protein [Gammaproteobacteria bacterium]